MRFSKSALYAEFCISAEKCYVLLVVGRVVAISEEVSEMVRVHMAWVGGNVNWERWF